MPNIWKWPFFRSLSEEAAVFRDQMAADVESGEILRRPRTLAALIEAHKRNRRRDWLYRLIDQPWLLPLSNFADLCQRAGDQIAEHGLFRGARMEVDRFDIRLDVEVSDEAQRLFDSNEPFLLVGNHPCIWGPDFWAVAASLENLCPQRDGLLLLMWTVVTALCPGLAAYSEPVVVTSRDIESFTHDQSGASDNRTAGTESLFRSWSPDIPVAQTREQTYTALHDMAQRWVDGEHVMIFPTGGAGTQALWFGGVGRVIRFAAEMMDDRTATDPHILFFRLKGATDFLMLWPPLLSRWHPARLVGCFFPRRIVVRYGETFRLRDQREEFLDMTNLSVARYFQERFDGAPPRPRRRSKSTKHRKTY